MIVFDQKTIALQFNDCINIRDIAGFERLMSDNHTFIDTGNNVTTGKQACLTIWKGFFKMFPDYKNVFNTITASDNLVIMIGYSVCSDKRLNGPAIWTAKITDGKISEWRIYEDTAKNRLQLDIDHHKEKARSQGFHQ
ncbi:MAG TPA: nuclear transport factor 2 family protein [Bacteroidia bacterium]|nr:nuclear transport factor 2 family protein [Bacteroidia bacterium]